ncbi:MAG: lytic murein transglycosylase B [Rubrivivax sp.]|nr:lytic murein transglycosylase B [Rubrivivax sp.]
MTKRLFLIFWLLLGTAQAADLPGIPAFIDEMVHKHKFKRVELQQVFSSAEHRPDVIESISKPAILRPWVEYRPNFINPQRINLGVDFWVKYDDAFRRAEQQYGVPQEIILGVIGVETMYGRNTGRYRALDALTTLAFDYPRRAEFFRDELENYLLLAREQEFDLRAIQASYAGALGVPQFMPSSYRRYAVDFNGNGQVDLLNEPEDAIGSVANYLKQYGWRSGEPVALLSRIDSEKRLGVVADARPYAAWRDAGVKPLKNSFGDLPPGWLMDFTAESGKEYWLVFSNFNVIMRYNNSNYYAMSVLQLAEAIHNERY